MVVNGLQIAVLVLIFAIHYSSMTYLVPLTYHPAFKWYSIAVHVATLIVVVAQWFFEIPGTWLNVLPIVLYSLIFAPLAGLLIAAIWRYFKHSIIEMKPIMKYIMVGTYGMVIVTFLIIGYYLFRLFYF